MKFSVVIVNYDSWPYTLRCLQSLRATGYEDYEVIVVDNNPRAAAPGLPSGVRLIRNETNRGFARACNQGIAASSGGLVVLLNPDALVEDGLFGDLEAFFRENPRAGIAGPRVVDNRGNLQLSARKEFSFVSGILGRTSTLTRLFPHSPLVRRLFPAAEKLTGPTAVDWVSGACMVLRREMLGEIGPMDERFFMYFEDADLCRRARDAGWLVYYLPQSEVLHHTGASSRASLKARLTAVWNLHKSAFLYHRKHGRHGPLQLYSALTLLGLCARASFKLVGVLLSRPEGRGS